MEIYSGIIHKAQKICVYGPEGIGKTTFASQAPDPLFIDLENGSLHLNVKRTQRPQNWAALLTAVAEIQKDPTLCRTLVIDTADKAETLCTQFVVEKNKVDSIESIGYGKGYVMVAEEFNKLLSMLENVSACGINVIITAHAAMRKFEQPDELGAYDRWELKLSKKVASRRRRAEGASCIRRTTRAGTQRTAGGCRIRRSLSGPLSRITFRATLRRRNRRRSTQPTTV